MIAVGWSTNSNTCTTPSMEAGIEDRLWSIGDLIELSN